MSKIQQVKRLLKRLAVIRTELEAAHNSMEKLRRKRARLVNVHAEIKRASQSSSAGFREHVQEQFEAAQREMSA